MSAPHNKLALLITSLATMIAGCERQAPAPAQSTAPPTTWVHSTHADKMRGTTYNSRVLISANSENFRFPYDGGSRLVVSVQTPSTGEPVVTVAVDRGQFHCGRVCDLFISFDGSPTEMFVFRWLDDGRRDLLISRESPRLIERLKRSNRFAMEATFFQDGTRQFFFEGGPLR